MAYLITGPAKNEPYSDIESKAPELTKLLRSPNFRKSPTRPKEVKNTQTTPKRDFTIESFLKWEEEQKRSKRSSFNNDHLLSMQSSVALDKLDPRCSFLYERAQEDKIDPKKDSSGQQSLENWARNAVRDVDRNGLDLKHGGKTSEANDKVKDKKLRKWF